MEERWNVVEDYIRHHQVLMTQESESFSTLVPTTRKARHRLPAWSWLVGGGNVYFYLVIFYNIKTLPCKYITFMIKTFLLDCREYIKHLSGNKACLK